MRRIGCSVSFKVCLFVCLLFVYLFGCSSATQPWKEWGKSHDQCLPPSNCLFVCLFVCFSAIQPWKEWGKLYAQCLPPSNCLFVCLFVCLFFSHSTLERMRQIAWSVSSSIYLFVVCLFVCLSVCLFVCLLVWLDGYSYTKLISLIFFLVFCFLFVSWLACLSLGN